MQLYNSLNKKLYDTTNKQHLKIYCCGPTIYNDSHLGHARTYIIFDSIVKYLRLTGKQVTYAMNITDIDDKIIKKVNEQKLDYNTFIKKQEKSFFDDLKSLNIDMPNKISRASDVIDDINKFIQILIDKKYAYESNGSVYFDVENHKYKNIMSNSNTNDIVIKNTHVTDKKNNKDFVLWKNNKDLPWKSPWGNGRSGWHIECSVMMKNMLGKNIDIHCGGCDLMFPHHHNEFLQTSAYYDDPNWIECFIHSGHLHINNVKMSQSLRNYTTIKKFLESYNSNQMRILFLSGKWNQSCNLDEKTIEYAIFCDKRFYNFTKYLETMEISATKLSDIIFPNIEKDFNNDFDSPNAIKNVLSFIDDFYLKKINKINEENLNNIMKSFKFFLDVLGIKYIKYNEETTNNVKPYIETIVDIRSKIKEIIKNGDKNPELYKLCDWIRDHKLPEFNVILQDNKNSSKWFFK